MVPTRLAMARTYAYANSFIAVMMILLVMGQMPTAQSYNGNGWLPSVATPRKNVRARAPPSSLPPSKLMGASLLPRHHKPVGFGRSASDLRSEGTWKFPGSGGDGGGGTVRCSSSARGGAVVLGSSSGDDYSSSSGDASFPLRSSSRRDFAASSTTSAVALIFLTMTQSLIPRPPSALAFDGGVGGLGKTKPETGVVFRDPETVIAPADGNGMIATELICPGNDDGGGGSGGKTVLVSFYAPWPMLRSTSSVESRDLANPEAAFLLVAPLPKKASKARSGAGGGDGDGDELLLTTEFFRDTIFAQSGKFGAYGAPSDVRVKKLPRSDGGGASSSEGPTTTPTLYVATFTTLTPAMRESERKAYVSAEVVRSTDGGGGGGGVFMLVAGTTRARFDRNEATLKRVAESFRAVEAPRSALAPGRRDGGSK